MKVLTILVVGMCIAFIARGALAREALCAPYAEDIRVDFNALLPAATYNNSLNVTGIRNLSRARGFSPSAQHIEALGVTYVTPAFGLELKTRMERRGGGFCVYLDTVKATFGFRAMEVYIGSEYPPGTCEHNAIRDHENQHVAINMAAAKEMVPRVRVELERLLALEKPEFGAEGNAVTKQKLAALTQHMTGFLNTFEETLATRNAVIDTAHNYEETAALCRNWRRGNVWPAAPKR